MGKRRKRGTRDILLDNQERTLLRLLSEGYDFDAISKTMNLSPTRISWYWQDIFRKMSEVERMTFVGGSPSVVPQSGDRPTILPRTIGERQIRRAIQRLHHRVQGAWSCLYIIDMSARMPDHQQCGEHALSPFSDVDLIAYLRHDDLVIQWVPHEWVIFLPWVTVKKIHDVLSRIRGVVSPCAIGWGSGDTQSTAEEVLGQARERALADLTDRTLGQYLKPPPSPLS